MNCCIVKRKPKVSSFLPLALVGVISVVLAVASLLMFTFYLSLVILIAGAAIIVYLTPGVLKTEYEYNLEGESFSVAVIKNNSSRKELFSCEMDYLVSCTPFEKRDTYTKAKATINAYSAEGATYYAIFTQEEQTVAVSFSPSQEFINSMRLMAPLKVKLI